MGQKLFFCIFYARRLFHYFPLEWTSQHLSGCLLCSTPMHSRWWTAKTNWSMPMSFFVIISNVVGDNRCYRRFRPRTPHHTISYHTNAHPFPRWSCSFSLFFGRRLHTRLFLLRPVLLSARPRSSSTLWTSPDSFWAKQLIWRRQKISWMRLR